MRTSRCRTTETTEHEEYVGDDDPVMDEPEAAGDTNASPSGVLARIRPVAIRVGIRSAVGLLVLVLVGWIAAAMGVGMRYVVPHAITRALPPGWTVTVGTVEGSWLSHMEMSGVDLRGPASSVTMEALELRYRVGPLFRRTIDVRAVHLDRPTVRLVAGEAGDEHGAVRSSDDPSALSRLLSGQPVGSWSARIESARISDGHMEIRSANGDHYSLAGLRLAARGSMDEAGLGVDLDRLGADFVSVRTVPADSSFRSVGRLTVAGVLRDGRLRLDTLALDSDVSRVDGGGHITFRATPEIFEAGAIELAARPLDLRDLPVRLPDALRERPEVTLSLKGGGTPDSLLFELEGQAFAGRTSTVARAVVRPERPESGTDAPALEGTLGFQGFDLGEWAAPPFDGIVAGDVAFTMERGAPASAFFAEGTLRHDPRTVDDASIVARPLRGDFEVRGQTPTDSSATSAPSPLRADGVLRVAAGPEWSSLGSVSAIVEGSAAEWRIDLVLDSARVDGNGDLRWGNPEFAVSVERLHVEGLDLSALDTAYPESRISGELRARFVGASLETATGGLDMDLRSSSVAELQVDTLAFGSDLEGRTARGTVFARGEMGGLDLTYVVELADSLVRFESDRLHYARSSSTDVAERTDSTSPTDVAERTDSTGPADSTEMVASTERSDPIETSDSVDVSSLGVDVYGRASGTWALSEARRGTLRAFVDSARWNGRSIEAGEVTARLEGERVVVDSDLRAVGLLPTPLRVRAHVDAVGTTLEELRGAAELSVHRAHAEEPTRVDSARVLIEAPGAGRFELDGSVRPAEGGRISFAGTAAASADDLRFGLRATGGFDTSLALLDGATIDSIVLESSGRRDSTGWRSLAADVTLEGVRWRNLLADETRAVLAYDSVGLRLDTLAVRSNVVEARGSGVMPRDGVEGRIDLSAELLDMEPLRVLSGREVLAAGGGAFEGMTTGSLDSLTWTASLDLRELALDRLRMTGLGLAGEGLVASSSDQLFGMASTSVDLSLDRIVLSHAEIRSLDVNATGGPDSIRVQAGAIVDDRRQGEILLQVDPRPDRRTARLETLEFRLDRDRWSMAEQAILAYGDGVSVEPILLRAGEQEIRIAGGVSGDGVLDLNARMDSTDVATVADLAGFPDLGGWLSGRVRVQGSTSAPEAWVDLEGALHHADRAPVPMTMRVRANGRRAQGDVRLADAASGTLQVSGGALLSTGSGGPSDDSPDPSGPDTRSPSGSGLIGFASDSLEVTVTASSFGLRWVEPFLDAGVVGSIGGFLDGSLTVRGTSAAPVLEGELRVRDGSLRPTALGVTWDALAVTVSGDGSDLVLDSARMSGGSGRMTARGRVGAIGAMPLDLEVSTRDFQAIRNDLYWGVVSGDVDVGGEVLAPTLEGRIRLEALDVFLDERVTAQGLEQVEFTEEDLRMLRERFGVVPDAETARRPFAERITADLVVELGRDSWLRKGTSPEMAVPFSGEIEVRLRPGEEPSLQGSVDVIQGRGYVEQFGRRFQLSEGTVTFNGPPDATRIDLSAMYTVPSHDNPDAVEVTIVLEVLGTQDDLSLVLSSEPPMENADIVSYIATGRPAAGSLAFQQGGSEGGLAAAGAGVALNQMTSVIEGAAARSVGLDVIEIRRKGLRQATLVAGKYVSSRLYIGFSQPVSLQEGNNFSLGDRTESELEVEFEALRWLIVNMEGSGSALRLFLRGRHAY